MKFFKRFILEAQAFLTVHDWLLKIVALSALGIFALSAWESIIFNPERSYSTILLVLAETITIVLILIARKPKTINLYPWPVFFAGAGTFHILFVEFSYGSSLIPIAAAQVIQTVGVLFQIGAKLSLGRSFGIVPANRGVKRAGFYRIVRHPIYLGYLICHVGFFLQTVSLQNAIVYFALYCCQILRIHYEEQELSRDPLYLEYKSATRWRLVPFIY